LTGLTYNGKSESGTELWDSCANIKIRNYERASTCHELILAFNINTNRWMAKWVFICRFYLMFLILKDYIQFMLLLLFSGIATKCLLAVATKGSSVARSLKLRHVELS